jgi:hypothetical protein
MLSCWLAAASCSGKTAPPSGPTAEQVCADLAKARCDKRVSCSNAIDPTGINLKRNFKDATECRAREALACVNGLAAPSTGNNPDAVEKCVAAYVSYSCADFLDNEPPTECMPKGTRTMGQPCSFNAQCDSAYCSGNKTATCGTCTAPPLAGASCSASNCAHGQQCVATTTLCQDRAAAGGTCDADHPCGSGLSCAGDTKMMMGTCQPAVTTAGTACGAALPGCAGNQGLACTGAAGAKTCTTMVFADDGMPCGLLTDGSRVDCSAGDCYTSTGLATGTDLGACKANAPDGAPCDAVLGPPCITPARCVLSGAGSAGKCTVPTGGSCN